MSASFIRNSTCCAFAELGAHHVNEHVRSALEGAHIVSTGAPRHTRPGLWREYGSGSPRHGMKVSLFARAIEIDRRKDR